MLPNYTGVSNTGTNVLSRDSCEFKLDEDDDDMERAFDILGKCGEPGEELPLASDGGSVEVFCSGGSLRWERGEAL